MVIRALILAVFYFLLLVPPVKTAKDILLFSADASYSYLLIPTATE